MKKEPNPPSNMRLNRLLALMGVTSRRKADELIREGRVSVDGKVVKELGTRIPPSYKEIAIDGVPVDKPSRKRKYYLLFKPTGVVTTLSDPEGRRSIGDLLAKRSRRLFPVGRLDYDSEGALLLTDDGELANQLLHPRNQIPKTYRVKVKGKPKEGLIERLRKGVKLRDGWARPESLVRERAARENTWFVMTISEGRNRLIRRLWESVDHPVQRLRRTSFAGVKLGTLRPGEIRELTRTEIGKLNDCLKDGDSKPQNQRRKRRTSSGTRKG